MTNARYAYAVYDVLGLLGGVLALPVLPVLALTRHGVGLGERLGCVPEAARGLDRPLWVHAASVGEVLAAEPLVEAVRRRRPDVPIVVTTTTVTGRATAARLGADAVMLVPADLALLTGRVMRCVRPRCLVLVETEIWPALLRSAGRAGVPCVVVSGRVSVRAAGRYARIRPLTRAMLAHVDACAAQTAADGERFVALGLDPARVEVIGSLKYAREARVAGPRDGGAAWLGGRPVLVAASTQPGEEAAALTAAGPLWAEWANLLLVLAPRRPERFDDAAGVVAQHGLRCERRSQMRGPVQASTQVLLLDTLGELLDFLPAALAVFVGGTLAPIGGHNVLEPAMFGKPVAFGPHTEGVAEAAEALLRAGAAVRVADAAGLAAVWRQVLADPEAAAVAGARGRAVVAERAAVAERTFAVVERYLGTPRAVERTGGA